MGPAAAIKAGANAMSLMFPGESSSTRGLPSASVSAWIFVVRPPRERPMASLKAPLFRRLPSDAP
jgi:hypothetical protein